MTARPIVTAFLALSFSAPLVARQEPQQEPGEAEHRPNHVSAFLGGTTSTERDETDFTLGGEYLREVAEKWSVGVFGEAVFTERTSWVLGPQFRWRVRRGFWLGLEPGLELANEESADGGEGGTAARALFRVGSGYEIEVGKWSVGPSVSIDVSKEKPSWVWGISVGTGLGSSHR
jgi:hypothetical protein